MVRYIYDIENVNIGYYSRAFWEFGKVGYINN